MKKTKPPIKTLLPLISSVLIIFLFIYLSQQAPIHAKLFIINNTNSVRLGLYLKFANLPNKSFLNITNKNIYITLSPTVLLKNFNQLSIQKNNTLHKYGHELLSHNILLLKKLSVRDIEYYNQNSQLPEYINIEVENPAGISSKELGLVHRSYIIAMYTHLF